MVEPAHTSVYITAVQSIIRRLGRASTRTLPAVTALVFLIIPARASADAAIVLAPSPTAGTCGSSQNILVSVKDSNGNTAANGTPVTFTTTFGSISSTVNTNAGNATAQLVLPVAARGTAQIRASALGASAQRTFDVLCSSNEYGAAASMPTAAAQAQTVRVRNFAYSPATLTAAAGQQISLNIVNDGPAPHTFTINGLTDSGSIAAGASKTLQFTAGQPGSLTFYCTIHGASVMSGTLTVTSSGVTAMNAPAMPAQPTASPPSAAPVSSSGGY